MIFATIWGLVLSTPLPYILIGLFRKEIVKANLTDKRKNRIIRLWKVKERFGWLIVIGVHLWCVFFLLQFVRYYSDVLTEKFLSATCMSVIYRLIMAPAVRSCVLLVFLIV